MKVLKHYLKRKVNWLSGACDVLFGFCLGAGFCDLSVLVFIVGLLLDFFVSVVSTWEAET